MADRPTESSMLNERAHEQPVAPALDDGEIEELVGDQEYATAFGEDLERTLDVDSWATGLDWEGAVARLKIEIRSAVAREEELRRLIRSELLPRIGNVCVPVLVAFVGEPSRIDQDSGFRKGCGRRAIKAGYLANVDYSFHPVAGVRLAVVGECS